VAYAETLAALSRRCRQGDIDDSSFQRFRKTFAEEWQVFAVVNVNEVLAGDLAVKHGLRGFDAIHLAAAIEIERGIGSVPLFFSSFDIQLNKAAETEGLSVLDEKAGPNAFGSVP
jgi:predicted nucleic acid-binding protein